MMKFKKICYVFPETKNFREERPRLCYEHMYGWIDGYGVLFDPVIRSHYEEIPAFSNGVPAKLEEDTFFTTASGAASAEFFQKHLNGLFLCPHTKDGKHIKTSQKERLITPCGTFFYPGTMPYERKNGNDSSFTLGENAALERNGDHLELYFEFFSMIGYWIAEYPHKRLLLAADMLAEILNLSQKDGNSETDLRLDCQSYGIARLYMQWLLQLFGKDEEELLAADDFYNNAVKLFVNGDFSEAQKQLKQAFETFACLRKKYIPTDYRFAEFPHAGILFPGIGFFELEWPEGSRQILLAHLHDAETNNYRASFELGANCWKELNELYPGMIGRFKELWHEKKITLTNGTWGLPYSFVSPLALQFWQFKSGNAQFEKLFGKSPDIYQCQENAFTPQMPELLKYFNYSGAIHASQNHGRPPCEKGQEICWKSPGGVGLHALVCSDPKQIALGINYFYDLPLLLFQHREEASFNAFSFMDLGFIPLREQMIRIAKYAPVFGRFVTPEELFSSSVDLEEKTYLPDDYNFSFDAFYRNYTNCNAISQYENVFNHAAGWRISQMLDFDTSSMQIPLLCSLEAHDCDRVQGQRPGEFYFRRTNETGPYSRDTLYELLGQIRRQITERQEDVYHQIQKQKTQNLFNPGEIPLAFAPVVYPEKYAGSFVKSGGKCYVKGNFAPFSCTVPETFDDQWETSFESGIAGKWQIQAEKEKIRVCCGNKKLSFSIEDHVCGRFELTRQEYRKNRNFLTAKLCFEQLNTRMEAVIMEGITSPESEYICWHLRYAVPADFRRDKRWEDYLALAFDVEENISVSNFVPNMLCRTVEKRICSSNCLRIEDTCGTCSLLFSGVGNFQRGAGQLDWLFHVADESVLERDITFSFGSEPPPLLARSLNSGLLPLDEIPADLPVLTDPEISLECRISRNKWLISNLSGKIKTPILPPGAALNAMNGEQIVSLGPWQLGELIWK
ncbi:MAG: hypothetical protein IKC05_02555 [Lentisphaeria bacterium]|nr:hypothetical protein [Lentisphaeria bacterium]